jgi:hypothetical protein
LRSHFSSLFGEEGLAARRPPGYRSPN